MQVFKTSLLQQSQAWRSGIEVVAMDGDTGFKTAAQEVLPDAAPVMDPFHVVQPAGDALDRTTRRVQQETLGHRGRKGEPLYGVRRSLRTGEAFLTQKQHERLDDPAQADVWRARRVYQQVVAASREKFSGNGRRTLRELIDVVRATLPTWFTELRKLGYTWIAAVRTSSRTLISHGHRMGRPKQPTGGSNTSAALRWVSGT